VKRVALPAVKHFPDVDDPEGRCVCGAEVVYFEPLDVHGYNRGDYGYGCRRLGRPSAAFGKDR
jgi:hypothetical protein